MIDVLIAILVFMAIMMVGSGIILAVARRRRAIEPRLGMLPSAEPAFGVREDAAMVRAASGLGRAFSLGTVSARLKEQLARAGYYQESAATTYLGIKLMLLAVATGGSLALFLPMAISPLLKAYLVVVTALALFFIPNLWVRVRRVKRSARIRNFLPDAVDLLEICVSSGMGLDMAWNAVSDEIRRVCPVLADEMALVNLEVQLGAPRTEAMRNMADRTGADELSSLVALLVQSDRFGTSIAEALRTFATSMREARSGRAEEAAERMAVKLLFPLVLFIFPVMLIVMVGPAGMTLYKVLGGG